MEITNVWSWYTCILNILIFLFGIGEGVGYIKCSWFDGEGYFYCVKAVLLISWFRVMYFDYFENVHHLFFGSSQNGTLTMLTASDLSFDCVQIFSPDIAVSKKLPCLNLPKLYCIDTHLTYIYIYCKSLDYQLCVWYYVIPVCCESVSIVLKLYFNLFFHINSISNESLITCIMVFGFHEKNDPFCQGAGHSIQQYRINPFNPSCSYIHQV